MRSSAIILVWLTTIFLVLLTIISQMNIAPGILFLLMFAGQILMIFMVYKVLTDNYKTSKTFEDWYEDHPVDKN